MKTVFNPENWKLTLPINSAGQLEGMAYEISPFSFWPGMSKYVTREKEAISFRCPDGGATTVTAKYARCELRGLKEFSYNEQAKDALFFRVSKLKEGHSVVVHQIHDSKAPWVKIVYTQKKGGGILRALVKFRAGEEDLEINLIKDLKLDDELGSVLNYFPPKPGEKNGKLVIRAYHGEKQTPDYVVVMKRSRLDGAAFFKRGNYYQNNDKKGFICEVIHV